MSVRQCNVSGPCPRSPSGLPRQTCAGQFSVIPRGHRLTPASRGGLLKHWYVLLSPLKMIFFRRDLMPAQSSNPSLPTRLRTRMYTHTVPNTHSGLKCAGNLGGAHQAFSRALRNDDLNAVTHFDLGICHAMIQVLSIHAHARARAF